MWEYLVLEDDAPKVHNSQLRIANWAGKVLRLLGLAQQCHRCAWWAVASAQRQNFIREAVALVDAADQPFAAEHAVIDIVFVGAGAEAGRPHLQWHALACVFLLSRF